jgi:signal transduction histidine kinase
MRRGHWIALDCAVGGFAALFGAAAAGHNLPGDGRLPFVLLFMAGIFLPVALRRKAPAAWFGALLILGVLLSGLGPALTGVIFLGAAFVLYTVTVEARRRSGLAALALFLAVIACLAVVGLRPGHAAGVLVPVALAGIIAWMTGYSVRQRRLYAVTVQHQAANSAVAEERLRIARELHDVVAHSMSVIAVQAGYGQYVIDVSPDGAKEALGAIQATSRDALDEMRRMLGVLRQQDNGLGPAVPAQAGLAPVDPAPAGAGAVPATARPTAAPLAPAPGLAGLDKLVARTCGAGVRVTVEVSGYPRPAPAGVDLSAYRIIQEALTNVVKHAGTGAVCVVSLRYTDADLVIRVTDDGGLPAGLGAAGIAAPGTGHGLIGMRERVHLCGGVFSAGPRPGGGFGVTAELPLPLPPVGRHPLGDATAGSGASAGQPSGAVRATGATFAAGAASAAGTAFGAGTSFGAGPASAAGAGGGTPAAAGTPDAAGEPVYATARRAAAVWRGAPAGISGDGSGE